MASESTSEEQQTKSTSDATTQSEEASVSAKSAEQPPESEKTATATSEPSATTATEPEIDREAAAEWGKLNELSQSLPQVKSYSQCKKIVRSLVGPIGRIWRKDNIIQIGFEHNSQKVLMGEGKSYTDALRLVAFTIANARAVQGNKEAKPVEEGKAVTEGGEETG